MQPASSKSVTTSSEVLLLRSGRQRCALALACVNEVLRPLPLRALPEAPSFVLGAAVLRGEAVPVLELNALLAQPSEPCSRWVSVRAGARCIALAVQSVDGVLRLESSLWQSLPALLGGEAGHVAGLASYQGELWALIDAARSLPESLWSQLEPGAA